MLADIMRFRLYEYRYTRRYISDLAARQLGKSTCSGLVGVLHCTDLSEYSYLCDHCTTKPHRLALNTHISRMDKSRASRITGFSPPQLFLNGAKGSCAFLGA
jgi:hypothetical protein